MNFLPYPPFSFQIFNSGTVKDFKKTTRFEQNCCLDYFSKKKSADGKTKFATPLHYQIIIYLIAGGFLPIAGLATIYIVSKAVCFRRE